MKIPLVDPTLVFDESKGLPDVFTLCSNMRSPHSPAMLWCHVRMNRKALEQLEDLFHPSTEKHDDVASKFADHAVDVVCRSLRIRDKNAGYLVKLFTNKSIVHDASLDLIDPEKQIDLEIHPILFRRCFGSDRDFFCFGGKGVVEGRVITDLVTPPMSVEFVSKLLAMPDWKKEEPPKPAPTLPEFVQNLSPSCN